jgi:Trk K+ transport system NAD-binding subunit
VLEIEVKNALVGKKVQDINIASELLVVAVRRLDGVIIPEPNTVLKAKDVLMAAVKVASLKKIKEKFNL